MNHRLTRSISKVIFSWLLLLSLCSFLFLYRLADRDLWSSHEARAAMDAQAILDDGNWGLPRLYDGTPEMQKPPLYYWLVALIAWCQGGVVGAWAVRLPSAAAALGGVLLLHEMGRRRERPFAGFVAALILATAMHYTWLARVGRIDMPLTLTITLTLVGCYLARRHIRARYFLLVAYLSLAMGLLLKGPIALVLPGAVMGLHLLIERELPSLNQPRQWLKLAHRLGLWWGLPLVLVVAGPWYLWVHQHTDGEFFRVFLWHHNVERGLGSSDVLREHPWWLYGPQFLLDFLPWSPLLLLAGWWLWKHGGWRDDAEARFGLVWLLAVIGVLSLFRFKRADYLLPAFPGAALFLGCVIERCLQRATRPGRLTAPFGVMVLGTLLGWLVYVEWILPGQESTREYRKFAEEIRHHAPSPEPVVIFHKELHPLAFRLGRPVEVMMWWHDLDAWMSRPGVHYVIMPRKSAQERTKHLKSCALEEVLSNVDLAGGKHEKPLVLLRSRPLTAE